ncbi:MAG: VWA domain-containing protein [Candidatus Omnitrophica bacterium]|nr:VWA domain-containing protein [Candidatus Omnitrophota bacterium]
MTVRKLILRCLYISLAVHAVFFIYSTRLKILTAYQQMIQQTPFFQVKKLKTPGNALTASDKGDKTGASIKFTDAKPNDALMSYVQQNSQKKEKDRLDVDDPGLTPRQINDVSVSKNPTQVPSLSADSVKAAAARSTRPELLRVISLRGATAMVSSQDVAQLPEVPEMFREKMPGFTPGSAAGNPLGWGQGLGSTDNYQPFVGRSGPVGSLQEFLISDLSKYTDPKTSETYFRIAVRVGKDALAVPVRPKEIIYLVDCSLSIGEDRLAGFLDGLLYGLKHFNKNDRFNLIAFQDKIVYFKEESVPVNAENMKQAVKFVNQLSSGKKTDTYNALYKSIAQDTKIIPSYIVLLTDGRPTQGVIDSRKLINEISAKNKGRIPIFAFSGGSWVNRYLLDFIAYKNRGWTEYAYRTNQVSAAFAEMVDKIRDPVLINVRFYVSGVDDADVFPKMLPDFFRGAEFTIFGRSRGEDKIVLQLLGDLGGKKREFMIEGDLRQARKGDAAIARHWAFNKIYHLIAQLEHDKANPDISKQIHALSARYKIETPYPDL